MIEGKTSFVKACKDYFGLDGSQAVSEFKLLTVADRQELHAGLIQQGYDLDPLGAPAPVVTPALVGV